MRKIFGFVRSIADAIGRANCDARHRDKWHRPEKGKRVCLRCGRHWNKLSYRGQKI